METQFVWDDRFNIGVDIIDKEHKRLFKIINKLYAFKDEEVSSQWACQEGIKFFKKHAIEHFEDEEKYMESINYEWIEQHKFLHKGFRENMLPMLELELEKTGYSPDAIEHFLGVCAGWLIGHTLTDDLAITGKKAKRWTNLLPNEELKAMERVIVETIFSMFHLESHLLSNSYNGDKFGNGVYYRLIYGTKGSDKKQEVFLVFEEKLLINTVGKILGIQTNKLDNMLVHAARYTSRQFAERVMEQFPDMSDLKIQSENLLSYEQFHNIFERENPHVSFLFDTGAGYFAYCVIAPHFLENNMGTPIEADNAMQQVREYLERREALSSKPKILIVDDSAIVRQFMCEMLSKDYDVTLAESSIDAIRNIALNKPDLVLLDYEMPVCDGRQMLAMIRSDQALADMPVIFLTGRNDYDSVLQVKSLKAEGYLLKNLDPEEIKKSIDSFFLNRE